jgi:hypothetical protein
MLVARVAMSLGFRFVAAGLSGEVSPRFAGLCVAELAWSAILSTIGVVGIRCVGFEAG